MDTIINDVTTVDLTIVYQILFEIFPDLYWDKTWCQLLGGTFFGVFFVWQSQVELL